MNYLLTVYGNDDTGLVESLASTIESLGGNWLESRLCRLEGQFTGIVRVNFKSAVGDLPKTVGSLNCSWSQMQSSDAGALDSTKEAVIKVLAADRPGIIRQISRILSSNGANIEEVESHIKNAPFSGEQMFEARYRISFQETSKDSNIQSGLESLAEELMCDLEYQNK